MTIEFRGRPPEEAVAYLRDKAIGEAFSFDWRDVWQEEHATHFVVAKGMQADLLVDIRAMLLQALEDGWTRAQFIEELTPFLRAKGWWGRQTVVDPATGAPQLAQLGSPRRIKTIFDVNMRMAHSAGRWERIQRSAATRPFVQYHHTPQTNPREQHQAWDGITVPLGHPFVQTHWTPNGWGCKCWWMSLRKAEVTSEEDLEAAGAYDTRAWTNKRTGEVMQVPAGVDPGFGYNVGEARLAEIRRQSLAKVQALQTPPSR